MANINVNVQMDENEIGNNVPNAETKKAIEDVQKGIGLSRGFSTIKELMEDLETVLPRYFFVAKTPFLAEARVWKVENFSPDCVGICLEQVSSFRSGLVFIPSGCILGCEDASMGTLNSQITYCDTDGLPIWEKKQ